MRLFTLTSDLHGELAKNAHNEQFIKDIEAAVGQAFDYRETDYSDYGAVGDIIYVRTGGTEAIFKEVFAGHEGARVRLLTSGQSNSLAASMEILAWLRAQGMDGEIIHGSIEHIASELNRYYPRRSRVVSPLIQPFADLGVLDGKRYGVVGRPSDWLISSAVDYEQVRDMLGAEIVDIPIEKLLDMVRAGVGSDVSVVPLKPMNEPKFGKPIPEADFSGAQAIYRALRQIIADYNLDGLTLRCFDLLTALGNTGCLALSMLNAEGFVAACEGDIPAMLSMAVLHQRYGKSGFQVNLSRISGGSFLFAHCTVPLNMVSDYCYDTHFESGMGVAIHGELPTGKARIYKISADMLSCIDEEVELYANSYEDNLCRTQVLVSPLNHPASDLKRYFLRTPLGNHHILVTGI